MARPVKYRKLVSPYHESKLFPSDNKNHSKDNIVFLSEEFEAIKLIDYEGFDQTHASKLMQISRPTFTRIYKKARMKIAASLVENKPLVLSEINVYFGKAWFKCRNCGCMFNIVEKPKNIICPVCSNTGFTKLNDNIT